MGILSWIVLGLIAGAIARWIMPERGPRGIMVTAVIGVAGAFLGGWIGTGIGLGSVRGFDLVSLFLAIVGAAVLLLIYHALRGRDSD
ncbi:MAG: GlsB/YeaQ/YmgE family stress response membrane protein [Gammaproteobacteria bacterium]|nr:GlsB/YeaQ/YmgE family stress response membrane protein [Gammaproteobacteria bacterium]MXY56829.1 GlsB/YeaQ/YmgE family stress response membrane protein [Gammaproteobacteria bacterium]MYF27294.1 GlsB/YeaQ/YmgE family stress response membrane protein [Gammaproteobacteria bacterium]MYK45330.1 GlsB/YeaQ/YmgE family stress response membrane protein [Gammaproteobacteria bacterium]